jgi:hypothetical protein
VTVDSVEMDGAEDTVHSIDTLLAAGNWSFSKSTPV